MNLEIKEEEYNLLVDLLEARVEELHPEIRHSKDQDFKEHLKHDLHCLSDLLQRLKAATPVSS
jgi:hypothetical protein